MPVLRPLARIWTNLLIATALTLALGLVVRWLLPHAPWIAAPALLAVSPADGAAEVLPRSAIRLDFSQPMNRQSTADALTIEPPTAGSLSWSDDSRSLTFQPAQTLAPNTAYTLRLAEGALGRWWRPIAPARSVGFRTAPLPAVVAALPASPGAPADGSVAIIFSQPMVAPDRVGPPASLPQLRFEPPFGAQMRWVDPSTLLVRPDRPLRAATSYRATIAPSLADLRGIELGQPYSWSWSTAWPEPLARAPADGARWVSPRQPLVLTLAAPIAEDLLKASLTIEPPTAGAISATIVGATQVITFTPRVAWQFGRSYQVRLAAPAGAGLAAPPDLRWRFTVEPAPGLIAFFPGQGQALPPGGEIRLIFSTPMDAAALRAGLRIDPPVPDVSLQVSETEVRLRPELLPSSAYTITVDARTSDRSGEPLGDAAIVRLRTAPADPAMAVPAATYTGVIGLPVGRAASIDLERINIRSLDLQLYRLDTPTSVRAINLAPGEWRDFQPERYGQPLLRSWQIGLGDPPDTLVRAPLAVGLADDAPLDPGVYYLRIAAGAGPRSDLLLVVSSVTLAMRHSDSQVLIWATDGASGAPLADLPLALYAGDALLARGRTGADGVWAQPIQRPARSGPYLALAEGPLPAVVRGSWRAAAPAAESAGYRSLLFLDQPSYRPGQRVQIGGASRQIGPDGRLAMPTPGAPCRIQLEQVPGAPAVAALCTLSADSGRVSGSLGLPAELPPGDYRLLVSIGASASALALSVEAGETASQLSFSPTGDGRIAIRATRDGLPLAGAAISWTLQLEPLALAAEAGGFHFADLPPAAEAIGGSAEADSAGQVIVALPAPPPGGATLRYRLSADLRAVGAAPASVSTSGLLRSAALRVGLRLPQAIVSSDQRARVDVQTLAADGAPRSGERVRLAIYRAGGSAGTPLLVRSVTSDPQGLAEAELVQLNPGEYQIVAASGTSASQATLWVVGGRFSAWANQPGQVAVIADRDSYRPGEVASLLVTSPYTEANLLLTSERGDLRGAQLRRLRAGQLITLTITPDMAPGISVGALLAAGDERRVGAAPIRVISSTQRLALAIAADRPSYAPGEAALLAISGAPAGADLLVTIAREDAPPAAELALAQFAPPPPAPLQPALLLAAAPPAATAAAPTSVPGGGYLVHPPAGAGAAGRAVVRVPLPTSSGRWRASAYALSSDGQLSVAEAMIVTGQPLAISPTAPLALRLGDTAEAGLQIRSTAAITLALRARLELIGGTIDPATPAEQQIVLAPGGSQRLSWLVRPRPGASAVSLRYLVSAPGFSQQSARELPVLAAPPAAAQALTLIGSGSLSQTLALTPAQGQVELAIAPSLAAALADSAAQLAALPERSTEQRASLLLLSAGLARSGPAPERARWSAVARSAAVDLALAQQSDGGWGWWPGTPARPFISAFAVEAQLAAADLGAPPSRSALAYLARAGAGLDPDAQAYLLYVRARASSGDLAAARALLGADLRPDGLAYLAQALPPAEAGPAIDRLLALADRDAGRVSWQPPGPAGLPRGPAAVNAAALQALRVVRPLAPELLAGTQTLLALWGVDGWPSPFDAARVAAALPAPVPSDPAGPLRVTLGDRAILTRSAPISTTQRLQLPADALRPGALLRVESLGDATYLVALRAPAAQQPGATRPILEQAYIDPQGGAPIDPAALRLGQLIGLRITLIADRPILRATLVVELPAALQPIELGLRPPFIHAPALPAGPQRLTLDAAEIAPGVYTLTIITRVSAVGQFRAPPPRLILIDEPGNVVVAPPPPPLRVARGQQ